MQVVPIRRGSQGLTGTLANANHHAKNLLPLVNKLSVFIPSIDYGVWRQGHNVHLFETKDGRKFVLRPWSKKDIGYVGIQLLLRISRSHEVFLACLKADAPLKDILEFVKLLEMQSHSPPEHEHLTESDHADLGLVQ